MFGFFRLKLMPNESARFNLNDREITIIDAAPTTYSLSLIQNDSAEFTNFSSIPTKYLTVSGKDVIFTSIVDNPIQIPLWILPNGLCGEHRSALSAERYLQVTSYTNSFNGKICLFSQATFRKSKTIISVTSSDSTTKSKIYSSKSLQHPEKEIVEQNSIFESTTPFIVQISGGKSKSLKILLEYSVVSPATNIFHCSIPPIPRIEQSSIIHTSTMLGDITFKCVTLARDMLSYIQWSGVFVSIFILTVAILQYTKIIDFIQICCPDDEKLRFESLKKDPYVQQITPTVEKPQDDKL